MDGQVTGSEMNSPILEPERTVSSFALFTYAWVLALSTWGGVVNYLSNIRQVDAADVNL